jgi:hypothetical protein
MRKCKIVRPGSITKLPNGNFKLARWEFNCKRVKGTTAIHIRGNPLTTAITPDYCILTPESTMAGWTMQELYAIGTAKNRLKRPIA